MLNKLIRRRVITSYSIHYTKLYEKNNLITPDVYLSSSDLKMRDSMSRRPELGEIYSRYVKRCQRFGAMDFDDLV